MIQTLVLILALGQATDAEDASFQSRLEATDPNDSAALVALAEWCSEQKRATWAALCYRRVLAVARDEATRQTAAYELARLDHARGDHRESYRRLRELARAGHEASRTTLEKVSSETTREQWALFEAGEAAEKAGDIAAAREAYEKAYRLAPRSESKLDHVPEAEILKRLASCVDRIDAAYHHEKVEPFERSVRVCKRCQGGFEKCTACDGKGVHEQTRRSVLRGTRIIRTACDRCATVGRIFCPSCVGLESTTEDVKITDDERAALTELIGKVRHRRLLEKDLKFALREVEKVILDEESSALGYLRAVEPRYTLSRDLRRSLATFPAPLDALDTAEKIWDANARNLPFKANFLLAYASELADHAHLFDMLRSGRRPRVSSRPDSTASRDVAVGPEILAAFPDDVDGDWIVVEGQLESVSLDEKGHKALVSVRGAFEHKVSFFVWLPTARTAIDRLSSGPWRSSVGNLSNEYPFAIHATLHEAPKGHRVTLVGRFLRDRLGFPRNWFEIWDLDVGFSPGEERLYRALREPVELSLENAELDSLARLLRWFDLDARFEGIDRSTRITCHARGASLAHVVNEIARALDTRWTLQDDAASSSGQRLRFARDVSRREATEVRAVLAQLDTMTPGEVSVRLAGAASAVARTPTPTLPDDVAGLERAAAAAIEAMDYGLASDALKALYVLPDARSRRRELARERYRIALFRDLTESTPRSHLVGAQDLADVSIQTSAGDTLERTVRVLRGDASHLWIQESYGGEVRVPTSRIVERRPLSATTWTARKRQGLDERAAELGAAGESERVASLFSLALFAKTNGIASRGTGFLARAIESDAFPWILETYFPAEEERLVGYWRKATGRPEPRAETSREADAAAVARAPTAPPPKEPVDEPLPTGAEALLEFARRHHREGRAHLRLALPGADDAGSHRRAALGHFRLAQEAATKLGAQDPKHEEARHLARDATLCVQTCAKDMGFFD